MQTCTCFMNSNQDTIFEWYDFLKYDLRPDKVNFNYIRPPSADPVELEIDHSRYAKLANMIDDDSRHAAIKNNYGGKQGFFKAAIDIYMHGLIAKKTQLNAKSPDEVLRGHCPKFLALKKQRRPGTEQQQRGHGAISAGRSFEAHSLAGDGVRNLIVVFEKCDEGFRRHAQSQCAARRFLPGIGLSLKKITVLRSRNEFLRGTEIVRVIRFAPAHKRNNRTVMKIVIPDTVEIVAAFAARPNQFHFLPFVLRHQNDGTLACGAAGSSTDSADDVLVRFVEDAFCRVEAKAVEVKLFDPIAPVGDEKLADRPRIRSVEIDGITPIVRIPAPEIMIGEDAEIIPVGAEVVVNDVENYSQAERMRVVDEVAQIIRSSVQTRRREKIDAVVTPPEVSGEIRNRHDFDNGDADAR